MQFGAGGFAALDVSGNFVKLLLIDDGAHLGGLIQWVAYRDAPGAIEHFFYKLIGDGALHEEPAAGVAAFTHVEVGAEDNGVECGFEICICKNNLRVFAAEFERYFFEVALRSSHDLFTHRR